MGRGGEPLTNTFSFCIYGCDYPREEVKAAFYKLDLIPKANELWELGSNTKKKIINGKPTIQKWNLI